MTWVLVLVWVHTSGVGMTTITGFGGFDACEKSGRLALRQGAATNFGCVEVPRAKGRR